MMYLWSLAQVREVAAVVPEPRVPALVAAVVNTALPKVMPVQESQT